MAVRIQDKAEVERKFFQVYQETHLKISADRAIKQFMERAEIIPCPASSEHTYCYAYDYPEGVLFYACSHLNCPCFGAE
ncbi:MAG: hypothetical protein FWG87_11420 [Defluviitaleaceae bacterium]|nr:hypothetical protein [Defluviitaleaceae bacterium]